MKMSVLILIFLASNKVFACAFPPPHLRNPVARLVADSEAIFIARVIHIGEAREARVQRA